MGGPTANFRYPACEKQKEHGVCPDKKCLAPRPCKNLIADQSEYAELLRRVEAVKGVKKVFVRSGIRFDYMLCDRDDSFFRQLVSRHVSGQLKVAPEHCAPNVLRMMGKPTIETYDRFRERFFRYSEEAGLEQYLVPYLMSSHPGSTMDDAAALAVYTKRIGLAPEQVQDFYPTPGTASTVMFYTGIDPFTGKKVYTPTDYREKQLQRALLQWRRRENRPMIKEAEKYCTESGRELLRELLGPSAPANSGSKSGKNGKSDGKNPPAVNAPAPIEKQKKTKVRAGEKRAKGWAVAKQKSNRPKSKSGGKKKR